MKKIFVSVSILIALCLNLQAQVPLYGYSKGKSNGGGIIRFDPQSRSLSEVITFPNDPKNPVSLSDPISTAGGKLFGVTRSGGKFGLGTIFSYDPFTRAVAQLFDFSEKVGSTPIGKMVFASDQHLYGLTSLGGLYGQGTIFRFDPVSFQQEVVLNFDSAHGYSPTGLIGLSSGSDLVGYTSGSLGADTGIIFSFNASTRIFRKLLHLSSVHIKKLLGDPIQCNNGKLYGYATEGATSYLYSFDVSYAAFEKLYAFPDSAIYRPGNLVQAPNGLLYGATNAGGVEKVGNFFSFDLNTRQFTSLYEFSKKKGYFPNGHVSIDARGRIVLLTQLGTFRNSGSVFVYDLSTSAGSECTPLFPEFKGAIGNTTLVSGPLSAFFGVATTGGAAGSGMIFVFGPDICSTLVTHTFVNPSSLTPAGTLIRHSDGKYYGVSAQGGSSGNGTIFSFDPTSQQFTKLHDFQSTEGSAPLSSLIAANDGKLYGRTSLGGMFNAGTLYSFDPKNFSFKKFLDFDSSTQTFGESGIIQGSDGKLYGIVGEGFSARIFSYDLSANDYKTFATGTSIYLNRPTSLTEGVDGLLYGIYSSDNANRNGGIFAFDPRTKQTSGVAVLTEATGYFTFGSLFRAGDNRMYGTAAAGGKYNHGTLLCFDPGTRNVFAVADFQNSFGEYPRSNVVESPDGRLYTHTAQGAANNFGAIVSYNPLTTSFSVEKAFDSAFQTIDANNSSFVIADNNTPPQISIDNPKDSSVYDAGTPVTLNAIASDNDGSIKKIEFYNDGVKFLEDSIAPYELSVGGLEPGTYSITARATDNLGASTLSRVVRITVTACTSAGNIYGEGFTNIPGDQVSDLLNNPKYPNAHDVIGYLPSIEYRGLGQNYGGRIRGYLCAPLTGDYTFYISGDDQAGLFLSTDDRALHSQLISYTLTSTGYHEYTKFASQKSQPIHLIKGGRYYIETLHKQGAGDDHLSVGWILPDGRQEPVIGAAYLSPFNPFTPPSPQLSGSFIQEMKQKESTGSTNTTFEVQAMPNPTTSSFTIVIHSSTVRNISMQLTDPTGKVLQRWSGIAPSATVSFGENLSAGMFLLTIQQGSQTKVLKLIKR